MDGLDIPGGIERAICELSNALSDKIDVTILTTYAAESFYALRPEVKVVALRSGARPKHQNFALGKFWRRVTEACANSLALGQWLESEQITHLYIPDVFRGFEAIFAANGRNISLVYAEHSARILPKGVKGIIKKAVLKQCRHYVSPTKQGAYLGAQYHWPSRFIPHMLCFEGVVGTKSNIVLNVGRLTADKGQLGLISAWRNLSIVNPLLMASWHLKIVGSGELEAELREAAHGLSIEILRPTRQIASLYGDAKIFALTSRSEGFGFVLLEAMASQCCVIAYDCDYGPRELIRDRENGLLVELGQQSELERLILHAIADEDFRGRMAQQARLDAESWPNELIVDDWIALIEND